DSLTRLIEFLRSGKIKALVGLDSLWTGVDVKGNKGILMSKLPFENPRDPLTYHRLKYLREQGEDPFEYQRRKAYIKFRQGVGRLVRQQGDAGTIILCDNRIWRYREFVEYVKSLGMRIIYKGRFERRRVFKNFW
ncbi:helicase C-terminal domain-containing protein, partial [Aquifex sp.]